VFTHFKLEIEPRLAEFDRGVGDLAALRDADTAWVSVSDLDSFGVPAPVRKLLESLQGSLI
jgi:A/G-specific adenine glycosylase